MQIDAGNFQEDPKELQNARSALQAKSVVVHSFNELVTPEKCEDLMKGLLGGIGDIVTSRDLAIIEAVLGRIRLLLNDHTYVFDSLPNAVDFLHTLCFLLVFTKSVAESVGPEGMVDTISDGVANGVVFGAKPLESNGEAFLATLEKLLGDEQCKKLKDWYHKALENTALISAAEGKCLDACKATLDEAKELAVFIFQGKTKFSFDTPGFRQLARDPRASGARRASAELAGARVGAEWGRGMGASEQLIGS